MKEKNAVPLSAEEKRAALRLAVRLSWASFWTTALYGAVFLAPFAVIVMFSGKSLLSFSCLLFVGAIFLSILGGIRAFFAASCRRADADVFLDSLVPLILGRPPREGDWKDGRPAFSVAWPLLRERLTAFSFGALMGSVIITAARDLGMAVLYLPLWFAADAYLLRQLFVRRLKFRHDLAAPRIGPALDFLARRQEGAVLRLFKKAVIGPAIFMVLWWAVIPVMTGTFRPGPSSGIRSFLAETEKIPERENGAFALLGLGAPAGQDVHAQGLKIAEELRRRAPATQAAGGEGAVENYAQLYAFKKFAWPQDFIEKSGLGYLDVYLDVFARLSAQKAAAIRKLAEEGRREEALEEWLRHTAFLGRLMQDGQTALVEYNRQREAYAGAMRLLPGILGGDRALAGKYAERIGAAFVALSPGDAPLRKAVDAETRIAAWSAGRQMEIIFDDLQASVPPAFKGMAFDFARASFRGGPGVLQGKLYWLAREMGQAIDEFGGDFANVHARLDRLAEKYSIAGGALLRVADLFSPHISVMANALLNDMPGAYRKTFFDPAAYDAQRMPLAAFEAVRAGAWPEGMEEFLHNAPAANPKLAGIASKSSFAWDAKTREICNGGAGGEDDHNPAPIQCLDTKPFVE